MRARVVRGGSWALARMQKTVDSGGATCRQVTERHDMEDTVEEEMRTIQDETLKVSTREEHMERGGEHWEERLLGGTEKGRHEQPESRLGTRWKGSGEATERKKPARCSVSGVKAAQEYEKESS